MLALGAKVNSISKQCCVLYKSTYVVSIGNSIISSAITDKQAQVSAYGRTCLWYCWILYK